MRKLGDTEGVKGGVKERVKEDVSDMVGDDARIRIVSDSLRC
jgi:hypothetical protein